MQLPTGLTVARSLLVATLVLVLVLGAAGCSSDPAEPATIDTTAPDPTRSSAAPSATPTPTATPVKQQVEAAVRTYYAELTRAVQTGDSSRLKPLISRECPCYKSVRIIDKNGRMNRRGPKAGITVRRITVHDVAGITAAVKVSYRAKAYDLVDDKDQVVTHVSARAYRADLSLVTRDRRWVLDNVFNLDGLMNRLLIGLLMIAIFVAGGNGTAIAGDRPCQPDDAYCGAVPRARGDQGGGAVVTEGVRFSRSGGGLGAAAAGAKGCTDCTWAVAPACQDSGPAESGLCAGALVGCPDPGQLRYRVYLRRGAGPWVLRGSVCLGPGQRPAGAVDLGRAVRERVRRYLPAAHPSFQPRAGAIVNLPTIFAAGQPATLRTEPFDLLGFTVVVTARARWVWTFDRGVTGALGVPGGGYPDRSVTHTYPDPGTRPVRLTTYWQARFTVDGQGPFNVPGPELTKTAGPIPVPVRTAHAELVGG